MAYTILKETSVCGWSSCGFMICGLYGVYFAEFPDNPSEPIPPEQAPLYIQINDDPVFPLRGSCTWSQGLEETNCTFDFQGTIDDRPTPYSLIRIGIGSINNLVFRGFLTSFVETQVAGRYADDTILLKYSCTCVGMEHYFVRKNVSLDLPDSYAGEIIKYLRTKYFPWLKLGTIKQGLYYEEYQKENMQAMTLIQELAQENEFIFYLDMNKRIHFYPQGEQEVAHDLQHLWEYTGSWSIPSNNYSQAQITTEAGQVINTLLLNVTTHPVCKTTYYETNPVNVFSHSIADISINPPRYTAYHITPSQFTFFTDLPIHRIKQIYVKFERINEDYTSYYGKASVYTHTFKNPRSVAMATQNAGKYYAKNVEQQYQYLDDLETSHHIIDMFEDAWIEPMFDDNFDKYHILNWKISANEQLYAGYAQPPDGEEQSFDYNEMNTYPFHWTIANNSITFCGCDIATLDDDQSYLHADNVGKILFLYVEIQYETTEITQQRYTNSSHQTTLKSFDPGTDGRIELTVDGTELISASDWQRYANAFFAVRGESRQSISYEHWKRGIDVFQYPIIPGMQQHITLHDYDLDLIVENVTYTVINSLLPILNLNIHLATKQRDLSGLIKRLLHKQYRLLS